MKKEYNSPEIEIERFLFDDALTSSGIGEGDAATDDLEDVGNPNPWA